MSKDVQRTCKRCGETWLLPKRVAREQAPNRLEMMGKKMSATGSSVTLFSTRRTSDQLRLANAEAKLERVLRNGQCPACGSSEFTQGAPLPVASKPAAKPTPAPAAKVAPKTPAPSKATRAPVTATGSAVSSVKGLNGTVTVESGGVWIKRTATGKMAGLTHRAIPMDSIVGVDLVTPKGLRPGHLRFRVAVDEESVDPRKDDFGVTFAKNVAAWE
jgi:hypothetical protein